MSTESKSWWDFLYNHNPFYVVSTVLMLMAVRFAYGEMPIGEINCWMVMGVLAGYTTLLAIIGVSIIRFGKVWDDARSILLLLLLLFLGISVSMDDLFVKLSTPEEGFLLAITGLGFSSLMTEAVLWLTGIRLGGLYRFPFYLFLGLFFFTPWWLSPEMHPRDVRSTELLLTLFPVAIAMILLSLLPAVWRGPAYCRKNGTPWRFPLYPWSMFVFLIVAGLIRSYALCLTFGPTGPIWRPLPSGGSGIVFATIWGTWFWVPIFLAILILLLEGGVVTRSQKLIDKTVLLAPGVLLLAFPWGHSRVFVQHWQRISEMTGSPLWLTVILLLAFFVWARYRQARFAHIGFFGSLLLLTRIGPETNSIQTLQTFQIWPIMPLGLLLLFQYYRQKSSGYLFAGLACLTWIPALFSQDWLALQAGREMAWGMAWLSCFILGILYRDEFSSLLRFIASMSLVYLMLQLLIGVFDDRLSQLAAFGISAGFLVLLGGMAWWQSSEAYYWGAILGGLICLYAVARICFHWACGLFGENAVTAFCWSVGTLLCALLISAHKAHWLNGKNSGPDEPEQETAPAAG
ncbi:MAG: hypothetical protein KDA78_15055 [Planctomycetaceae bacterium]|nr:hypothetical protein [Planctomycetaceae bacterium]